MRSTQKSPGYEVALDVLRRRKWLGILVFAAIFTAVVSAVVFLPDVYQSTATVIVEGQKVPEAFVQSAVTLGIDDRLQTITQQILSRSRLEELINRFNLYPDLLQDMPRSAIIERMRQDIRLDRRGLKDKKSKNRATVAFAISY